LHLLDLGGGRFGGRGREGGGEEGSEEAAAAAEQKETDFEGGFSNRCGGGEGE